MFKFLLLFSLLGSLATATVTPACARVCQTLSALYNIQLSYPTDSLYQFYSSNTNTSIGYWSARESEILPACRFLPNDVNEVALAVATLAGNSCPFAIRSGGHMQWPGAANIQDGVTIDLGAINHTEVVTGADGSTLAKIGPGARWVDVYKFLDVYNLTVPAARVSTVGVGGFLTGGGMNFYASEVGFSCDNVQEYEVVLSSGLIVYATSTQNSDLFHALKGGNNNFGIITSFQMTTLPSTGIWGGTLMYPSSTFTTQFTNFYNFEESLSSSTDIKTFGFQLHFNQPSTSTSFIANVIGNTANIANPPLLSNFTSLPNPILNTLRHTTQDDLVTEIGAGVPYGHRQLLAEVTIKNNLNMLHQAKSIVDAALARFESVNGFQSYFILQPIHRGIFVASEKLGGNVLGLTPDAGNLVWVTLVISWDDANYDSVIDQTVNLALQEIKLRAQQIGAFHPFIYLNYASQLQDPISSYNSTNVQFLQSVSRKYDNRGIFQTLVKGGFKLFGKTSAFQVPS